MAAVGQFNSGVTPVLHLEHHAHKDCEQSHSDKKKLLPKKERLRRGRQRDKWRLQELRDKLASASSSSTSSDADARQDLAARVRELMHQVEQMRYKLSLSVHKQAAQQTAINTLIGVCYRMSAPHGLITALVDAVNSALANLAASSEYVLVQVPAQDVCATGNDNGNSSTGQEKSAPIAYDIYDADDRLWTEPYDTARPCNSGDAAAGASSTSLEHTSQDIAQLESVASGATVSHVTDTRCAAEPQLEPQCHVEGEPDSPDAETAQPSAGVYQAWSGKGMATPRVLHTITTRFDNLKIVSQDVSGHVASVSHARQAPEDVCTSGGLRQAHDDDNAVHRTTCATGVPETGVLSQFAATQEVRQAHDVDNAVHRTCSATDVSETCDLSQSTATQDADDLAEQCGPLPSTHTCLMSRDGLSPMCLAEQPGSLPTSNACMEDYNSQDLTEQRGPLPSSPPKDLGPSTIELQKLQKDFTLVVAPLIGTYCRRRDPSLGYIRATATKILQIAKRHGVTKEFCCQHLRQSSLALTTAASELW